MNQNALERIFRNGSDGKRRFCQIWETWKRFSELCKWVINWNTDFNSTCLHLWYGIPIDEKVPLRLPVTLVPILKILQWLQQCWIETPQCVIYQATDFISQVNNIDIGTARNIWQYMERGLRNFVQENFPELQDNINFYFWPQCNDQEIIGKIIEYSRNTSSILNENQKNHFKNCESKHSNWEWNALLYLTANTYYNGWYSEYPFPEVWDIKRVIPIWWRSEKQFFEILLETQTQTREIFPLITQVWAYPSYYWHKRWDIFTKDELWKFHNGQLPVWHPDIAQDLQILSSYNI